MRVLVALSGGVDSAVAAARLLDAGHDVAGVHLALLQDVGASSAQARRAANELGIELDVWDLAQAFTDEVVGDFVGEYAAGRTPNPCLRCNATIKFGALLERGLALGFDALATGHYARLERTGGSVRLLRSPARGKDQSYVLGVLRQEQLRHVWFPLGDVASKDDVRAEAARRGLAMAGEPDSTDICFIPDGGAAGYLRAALGARPGEIVDADGAVVGTHSGAYQFTVGQRRGLRLTTPATDGRPRFVLRVDAAANKVIVGPRAGLAARRIRGSALTWTGDPAPGPWHGLAQWRAHQAPVAATFAVVDDALVATLDAPAYGVAPGQRLVLYDGDYVIGSAVIEGSDAC